jgi:6-phospho-beta-glucosidase
MTERNLTLCIVGAGSSYTPELIDGLMGLSPERLSVGRINLADLDRRRLGIMAGLSRRMISAAGRKIVVSDDTSLERMLEGADFVITQIRVGGMKARHLDESIPLKYGIIGQETTGPGGMFKALRTIPPMLEIARAVCRVCPEAFMLNYTNPSGIITEAVTKHTGARFMGLCSGIPGMQRRIREQLGDAYPDLHIYCVGLNHLGFAHRIVSDGRDVTSEVIDRLYAADDRALTDNAQAAMGRLVRTLGAIPISYVNYYYRRRERVLHAQQAPETRAQVIMGIEEQVLAEAADETTHAKPQALRKRGGGGYSNVTFSAMDAIHNDTGAEVACSVPNRGTVQQIDDDAAVEVVCKVGRDGPVPIPVGPIPLAFRGLVLAVKTYESLTVEAAVKRSRALALRALLNHPLVGDLDVAEPLLDEMLQAHGLQFE